MGVLHKILRELALVLPTLPGDRVLDRLLTGLRIIDEIFLLHNRASKPGGQEIDPPADSRAFRKTFHFFIFQAWILVKRSPGFSLTVKAANIEVR